MQSVRNEFKMRETGNSEMEKKSRTRTEDNKTMVISLQNNQSFSSTNYIT